jgi:MFS family permease
MQAAFLTRGTMRHLQFRGLWAGGSVYFVGNAMQTMAASWMMVELSGSSFLAALVQTAVFLPMFLFSLPAGVLADITDRRRLILLALAVQAGAGSLLAILSLTQVTGPGGVLFLIFVAGSCTALMSPAWNSTVAQSVPREELPQAIIATSVSYNGARALGPALAGLVFVTVGGAWNFALAVVSTAVMMQSIRRWPPAPHPLSRLPAERLWGGMMSALRFAWHSHTVLAQLVRSAAYSGAGSALWALLPVIGQRQLGLGASGFGLMMGCLGSGAVIAGLLIGRVRARFGLEALVASGCVAYALVMLIAAFSRWHAPVYLALVVGGGAWMSVMSTFNTATQTSVPPWVRARAVAMHTLAALGAFAIGSAFWGALSDIAGLSAALVTAAVCMGTGPLMARRFPLRMGEMRDVTPATPSLQDLFLGKEPDPTDGPIAVEMAYRIDPHNAEDFLSAVTQLRATRRRDGATFWRVYRDLADPNRYLERFIVSSWADYLHQRARATMADHELESHARSFLLDGESVTMHHYIAER